MNGPVFRWRSMIGGMNWVAQQWQAHLNSALVTTTKILATAQTTERIEMARDQAKPSDSKGKKKAERHSSRTRENKRRQAETRAKHLYRAMMRRMGDSYTDPVTGKKATRFQMSGIREIRLQQQGKINKKREQRKTFAAIPSRQERDRRRAAAPEGTRTKPRRLREPEPVKLSRVRTDIDLSHILA